MVTARGGSIQNHYENIVGETGHWETLWVLPELPLTEMLGPYDPDFPAYDQELIMDMDTGHVRLKNIIDPGLLYQPHNYAYRTNASPKHGRDLTAFLEFLEGVVGESRFSGVVDIGGNDLVLARQLKGYGAEVVVIDPVCSEIDGETVDGVGVLGRFIEDVNLREDIGNVQLVVCRHTLEHIQNPLSVLEQIIEEAQEGCIFIFEVPSLTSMIESHRFDAVIHQHIHYFDFATFYRLVDKVGGAYIDHKEYLRGPCGGSLFFAFSKGGKKKKKDVSQSPAEQLERIRRSIDAFTHHARTMGQQLIESETAVYGYGAGLMISTLQYHVGVDFSHLTCVLDDDESKDGLQYKNVNVTVSYTSNVSVPDNSNFLITSLENIRPIFSRIIGFNPRRIILPITG